MPHGVAYLPLTATAPVLGLTAPSGSQREMLSVPPPLVPQVAVPSFQLKSSSNASSMYLQLPAVALPRAAALSALALTGEPEPPGSAPVPVTPTVLLGSAAGTGAAGVLLTLPDAAVGSTSETARRSLPRYAFSSATVTLGNMAVQLVSWAAEMASTVKLTLTEGEEAAAA